MSIVQPNNFYFPPNYRFNYFKKCFQQFSNQIFHKPKTPFRHRIRPFRHAWVGEWGDLVYLWQNKISDE